MPFNVKLISCNNPSAKSNAVKATCINSTIKQSNTSRQIMPPIRRITMQSTVDAARRCCWSESIDRDATRSTPRAHQSSLLAERRLNVDWQSSHTQMQRRLGESAVELYWIFSERAISQRVRRHWRLPRRLVVKFVGGFVTENHVRHLLTLLQCCIAIIKGLTVCSTNISKLSHKSR